MTAPRARTPMTSADLWAAWRLWMLVAAAIIAVAAALLVTIWLTARSIAVHATHALKAAEAIRNNTRVIWELQTTNEVAEQIRDTVHIALLDATLHVAGSILGCAKGVMAGTAALKTHAEGCGGCPTCVTGPGGSR